MMAAIDQIHIGAVVRFGIDGDTTELAKQIYFSYIRADSKAITRLGPLGREALAMAIFHTACIRRGHVLTVKQMLGIAQIPAGTWNRKAYLNLLKKLGHTRHTMMLVLRRAGKD